MHAVGLKVLKNRLSEYVRLAQSGEVVLITDRDRVVAELSPPATGRAETLRDAELAEAVRKGWITPPTAPGRGVPPRQPALSTTRLSAGLDGDRSDRW
jgi:antitoxin (DNA-binding transcriptional repressor) of toxin-antitoxin stability system